MLVALLVCQKDISDLRRLIEWMKLLDGKLDHDALIVCDAGAPFQDAMELRNEVRQLFRTVKFTTNGNPVKGWPDGCYSLFKTAVKYVAEKWPQPFLIVEPDCVPLKKGWLNDISDARFLSQATFMGHIYECSQPNMPQSLMSGIAVYPPDTYSRLPMRDLPVHWDVDGAGVMVSQGVHTPLIHHFFGKKDLPPTFVEAKKPEHPINAVTLDWIPKEAVLFHRNKDGTLIRLLKRKLFPHLNFRDIIAVFNVHRGDIGMAVTHAQWLKKMGMKTAHKAIIAHDISCPIVSVNKLADSLRQCFADVKFFVYPRPIGRYPQVANAAWQAVATHMAKQDNPWLWMEADAAFLKPDAMEQLQREYDAAQRSWMGVIVPHMGHMQGTAVYPADAAHRMKKSMSATVDAWDMLAKDEIMHDCHNANRIMMHVWTLIGGNPHPVGGGDEPRGITAEHLKRWLPKEAVMIHRIKDASLIDLLLRGEYQP